MEAENRAGGGGEDGQVGPRMGWEKVDAGGCSRRAAPAVTRVRDPGRVLRRLDPDGRSRRQCREVGGGAGQGGEQGKRAVARAVEQVLAVPAEVRAGCASSRSEPVTVNRLRPVRACAEQIDGGATRAGTWTSITEPESE